MNKNFEENEALCNININIFSIKNLYKKSYPSVTMPAMFRPDSSSPFNTDSTRKKNTVTWNFLSMDVLTYVQLMGRSQKKKNQKS